MHRSIKICDETNWKETSDSSTSPKTPNVNNPERNTQQDNQRRIGEENLTKLRYRRPIEKYLHIPRTPYQFCLEIEKDTQNNKNKQGKFPKTQPTEKWNGEPKKSESQNITNNDGEKRRTAQTDQRPGDTYKRNPCSHTMNN